MIEKSVLGLWLSWIEQAPPEYSGTRIGNSLCECGQSQGSLRLCSLSNTNRVILSQALFPQVEKVQRLVVERGGAICLDCFNLYNVTATA